MEYSVPPHAPASIESHRVRFKEAISPELECDENGVMDLSLLQHNQKHTFDFLDGTRLWIAIQVYPGNAWVLVITASLVCQGCNAKSKRPIKTMEDLRQASQNNYRMISSDTKALESRGSATERHGIVVWYRSLAGDLPPIFTSPSIYIEKVGA